MESKGKCVSWAQKILEPSTGKPLGSLLGSHCCFFLHIYVPLLSLRTNFLHSPIHMPEHSGIKILNYICGSNHIQILTFCLLVSIPNSCTRMWLAHFNPMSVSLNSMSNDLKAVPVVRTWLLWSITLVQRAVLRELEMAVSWEDRMMTHSLWGLCLTPPIYKVGGIISIISLLLNEGKES